MFYTIKDTQGNFYNGKGFSSKVIAESYETINDIPRIIDHTMINGEKETLVLEICSDTEMYYYEQNEYNESQWPNVQAVVLVDKDY